MRLAVFSVLLLLLSPEGAAPHTRSQSFSSWRVREGEVRVTFQVRSLEGTRLGALYDPALGLETLLLRHLSTRLAVASPEGPCPADAGPRPLRARPGFLRAEWRFHCPPGATLEIRNDAFFELAPSHIHYARVRSGDEVPVEYLFTDDERRRTLPAHTSGAAPPEPQGASFSRYLGLGAEHILVGFDHLAFLLALLLLCRRVRDVAFMVTGFTLGHSITLTLAALGLVEPDVPVIESLIGFTIALVAAETLAVRGGQQRAIAYAGTAVLLLMLGLRAVLGVGLPALTLIGLALFTLCHLLLASDEAHTLRMRPLLTVLFGLVHGFGFASVLMEIGLPTERLAVALLGFNVGVEIGQLAVVALLWLAGRALAPRLPEARRGLALEAASAALCALGVYWFVERAFA